VGSLKSDNRLDTASHKHVRFAGLRLGRALDLLPQPSETARSMPQMVRAISG
jgi:hypothetical protein